MAVSDGSHKGEYAATSMTIEGPRERYKRILGTSSSPGRLDHQDSYRGYLTVLDMIATSMDKTIQV